MMRRRVKKTKPKGRNNFGSDEIPEDLVMEIIGRLPVKTVARFVLVSKSWARIIRSREFIASFPIRSCSSQPRLLVAYVDIDKRMESQDWDCRFFSSSYSSSSTSFLSRVAHSFPTDRSTQEYYCGYAQANRRTGTFKYVSRSYYHHEHEYYYSHYVNGLVSLGYGQEQIICNPSTGQFTILPKVVETRGLVAKSSFFGYDPVNDEYKVLCMTKGLDGGDGPYQQYQVFTLGAKPKSWTMIDSSIPHSPLSNGLCIGGAVYYVASTRLKQMSLMRFDLRSEKLDRFTSLSADLQAARTLINYEGKIAIPIESTSECTFDVWVMDQDAEIHEWSKKITLSLEPWKRLFGYAGVDVTLTCITRTGEIIFKAHYDPDHVCWFHYNHKTNNFRMIEVDYNMNSYSSFKGRLPPIGMVCSDYVESVRFL